MKGGNVTMNGRLHGGNDRGRKRQQAVLVIRSTRTSQVHYSLNGHWFYVTLNVLLQNVKVM